MKVLDATPTKNIYSSIIADYDVKLGVCELIDNVIDSKIRRKINSQVIIDIEFDFRSSEIKIEDNSGGVKEENLALLVSPGQSENDIGANTIGLFGVGSKRAVVSLAKDIRISTRYANKQAYRVKYDDDWLNTNDWSIDYEPIDSLEPGTTIIELSRLRKKFDQNELPALKEHLSYTYAHLMTKHNIEIIVNGEIVKPQYIDNWVFPPQYLPKEISGCIPISGTNIEVKIQVGLVGVSNPNAEYGINIYCNDRLIERNINSEAAGYISGKIGKPHPSRSLANGIIYIYGSAEFMPWNSSKSRIDVSSDVFRALYQMYIDQLSAFSTLSYRCDWKTEIFPYKEGDFEVINSINPRMIKNYTPTLPKVRISPIDVFKKDNKELEDQKPWLIGVHEGVVAIDDIQKIKINSKNRIALIVLDSTLEIAFKEYLTKESGEIYSDARLAIIMKNRHEVHKEVEKFIENLEWAKIDYFYSMRCKLVHEKATVSISNDDIRRYRVVVEDSLNKMFGSSFT